MRSKMTLGVLVAMMAVSARPAFADVTAFIGANTSPANRQVRGFGIGMGLLVVVGIEFEYTNTTDDPTAKAPSLKIGSGNLVLQSPVPIFGVQPYFTTGGGFYSETLGTRNDTGFAPNTGGGVKISLLGPIGVRVDYRVFKLASGALVSPAHRVYAGINLKF
ncbi:MAG: hypothetical protein ABJA98_19075 [Acidobacteriota bacterium]